MCVCVCVCVCVLCWLLRSVVWFSVGELRQLVSLQVLDLRHNKLKSVPTVVYELVSLQTCYLSFNKITAVSPAIGNLTVSLHEPGAWGGGEGRNDRVTMVTGIFCWLAFSVGVRER